MSNLASLVVPYLSLPPDDRLALIHSIRASRRRAPVSPPKRTGSTAPRGPSIPRAQRNKVEKLAAMLGSLSPEQRAALAKEFSS